MDFELENGKMDGFKDSPNKSKSSHRIHYEAQVEVIRQQIGELEEIRQSLGLSQRKICQLLMVDPSAWTRWTRKGESAPPHIYRALQWYSIVQEKLPGLTPQYFLGKNPQVLHQTALQKIEEEALKRQEFEEASALQSLKLERRIEELQKRNDLLAQSKSNLENEIQTLKSTVIRNRTAFQVALLIAIALVLIWVTQKLAF